MMHDDKFDVSIWSDLIAKEMAKSIDNLVLKSLGVEGEVIEENPMNPLLHMLNRMQPMFRGQKLVLVYGDYKSARNDFNLVHKAMENADSVRIETAVMTYGYGEGMCRFKAVTDSREIQGFDAEFIVVDDWENNITPQNRTLMAARTQAYLQRLENKQTFFTPSS